MRRFVTVCVFLGILQCTLSLKFDSENELVCGSVALKVATLKRLSSLEEANISNLKQVEASSVAECVGSCCKANVCNLVFMNETACMHVSCYLTFFKVLS